MYLAKRELSRAVLIGTGDFQSPDLPRLPAVKNNLIALYQALTHPETGILPEDNCEMVQDPDSPDSLMDRLGRTAEIAEDLLLVYYAGHGLRHHRRDDDLYLSVRQTRQSSLDGTAVKYDWVREVIADCSAKTRLLILDCCFSGLALDRMSSAGVDSQELTVSGTAVLASSPRNKTSHSPAGERYTGFTGELLHCLKHGSPLSGEPLTVLNAYKSLRAGLARRELPKPILRTDDTSGEVLLRRQPKPKQVAPPQPLPVKREVAPPPPPPPPVVAGPLSAPQMRPLPPAVAEPRNKWVHTAAPVRAAFPVPSGPVSSGPTDAAASIRLVSQPPVSQTPSASPPVVVPVPAGRSVPVWTKISKWVAKGSGNLVFWFFATAAGALLAGGVSGLLFASAEYRSGDRNLVVSGAACGILVMLVVEIRRRRGSGSFRSEISALLPRLPSVPAGAIIALTILLLVFTSVMLIGDTSRPDRPATTSELATKIGGATWLLAASVLFGSVLLRRRRSGHQAAAGDEG